IRVLRQIELFSLTLNLEPICDSTFARFSLVLGQILDGQEGLEHCPQLQRCSRRRALRDLNLYRIKQFKKMPKHEQYDQIVVVSRFALIRVSVKKHQSMQ